MKIEVVNKCNTDISQDESSDDELSGLTCCKRQFVLARSGSAAASECIARDVEKELRK